MPHPDNRDDSINQAIQTRLSSEQGVNVNYHDLRERVRSGSLGDLDRDATWEALSDAVEGFDYDISEGYSAERGTQPQDEQDSARLSGLLGEFEKKFGQPDHWKWGPVGTDDYDYDAGMEAGHGGPSEPSGPTLPGGAMTTSSDEYSRIEEDISESRVFRDAYATPNEMAREYMRTFTGDRNTLIAVATRFKEDDPNSAGVYDALIAEARMGTSASALNSDEYSRIEEDISESRVFRDLRATPEEMAREYLQTFDGDRAVLVEVATQFKANDPDSADVYDALIAEAEMGGGMISGPTPSPMSPMADSRMDSIRSAVDDYQSNMDYGSPDLGMPRSIEYRGMMNQPSSAPRRGRGRINY